jgi:hypothetical protein
MRLPVVGLLFFVLPIPAEAVIFIGNPNLDFTVDRPAHDYIDSSVVLDKVRFHYCAGGSTDVQVDETLDLVAGSSVGFSAGDYCGLTFYWDSVLDIDGPGYTVRYSQATTAVTLEDDTPDPVALTPYSVISGSMSGAGPSLYLDFN